MHVMQKDAILMAAAIDRRDLAAWAGENDLVANREAR